MLHLQHRYASISIENLQEVKNMELKKFTAVLLSASLLLSQGAYLTSYAITENQDAQKIEKKNIKKAKKNKKEKAEINKVDYINLDFWNNYNDDNLKYFILRAVESNHDLKMAKENVNIYYEYVKMQRSRQLPSIGLGGSPGYFKMMGTSDYDWMFMAPVFVNYEADIFLKNRDKTLLSKKDYELTLQDERAAYITVASSVGTVYFNILKLDKAIEIQEEIVNLRKEIYELMKLSNEEGITSIQDVIRADKAYINGKTALLNLEKQRLQLINNLAVLVGARPDDAGEFQYSDIENLNFSKELSESYNSYAIDKRPDYLKAELSLERSGIDIRVAKKEFLPSINISGMSIFNAGDLGSIFTAKNAIIGISGLIAGELFSGGRKMANLRVKKAEYEKMLQNYEKTNLTALQELNDALVAIKHDKTKLNETIKQNELEIKDYSLRELRFSEGVISKLELIQSKENLLSTKLLVLNNKADCFIDYIGLYKTLGANI